MMAGFKGGRWRWGAIAGCVVALLGASSWAEKPQFDEVDWTIVIGGDEAYPPFEFRDPHGVPLGFAPDLMRAIARETGAKIEIRLGPWTEMIRALEAGEVDALEGMYHTPERASRFDFSTPVTIQPYVAVVRKGERSPPESWEALTGMIVAVQAGDLMDDELRVRGRETGVLRFRTQSEALEAVSHGRADCALVAHRTVADLRRSRWEGSELAVASRPIHRAEYCVAVAKGNTHLLAFFNSALATLSENGELRRIHERWLGALPRMPMTWKDRLLIAGEWLLVLALVAIAAILWGWSTQRVVRRRTAELAESEARYRTLITSAPTAVFVLKGLHFAYVNPAACGLFGAASEQDLLGRSFLERVAPEDHEDIRRRERLVLQEDQPAPIVEHRYRRLDGTEIVVEACGTRIIHDGEPAILVFAQDVTERVRDRQRIGLLNELLRLISEINQKIVRISESSSLIREAGDTLIKHEMVEAVLVVLSDASGHPSEWVAKGQNAVFDAAQAALKEGRWPFDLGQQSPPSLGGRTEAVPGGAAGAHVFPLRHREEFFGALAVVLRPPWDQDLEVHALLCEIVSDLSFALHDVQIAREKAAAEQRERLLTEQLAHAEKMEAIGRLAGGVAHDFNNLLMTILGNVDMCRIELSPNHPAAPYLDEIANAVDRATGLTRQLLAFARRQTVAPRPLDVNAAIANILDLVRRLIGEHIELQWAPGEAVKPIVIDPGQVDQLVVNLCVNARDAIAGSGWIRIETATVTLNEDDCLISPDAKPGEYTRLTVSDNGCGMTPDVVSRIFEPFFTTKKKGIGTGLGLSVVEGIVKQNQGFIVVRTAPGEGASFSLYFPAVSEAAAGADALGPLSDEAPRGHETILLVEDEPTICTVTERFLRGLGYTVIASDHPIRALERAERYEGPIHLVLTDVIMPEMNGRELVGRLQKRWPEIRCIFMSGYTANIITHSGVLEPGIDFLQKPVAFIDLARKIRAVLDRPA